MLFIKYHAMTAMVFISDRQANILEIGQEIINTIKTTAQH